MIVEGFSNYHTIHNYSASPWFTVANRLHVVGHACGKNNTKHNWQGPRSPSTHPKKKRNINTAISNLIRRSVCIVRAPQNSELSEYDSEYYSCLLSGDTRNSGVSSKLEPAANSMLDSTLRQSIAWFGCSWYNWGPCCEPCGSPLVGSWRNVNNITR